MVESGPLRSRTGISGKGRNRPDRPDDVFDAVLYLLRVIHSSHHMRVNGRRKIAWTGSPPRADGIGGEAEVSALSVCRGTSFCNASHFLRLNQNKEEEKEEKKRRRGTHKKTGKDYRHRILRRLSGGASDFSRARPGMIGGAADIFSSSWSTLSSVICAVRVPKRCGKRICTHGYFASHIHIRIHASYAYK